MLRPSNGVVEAGRILKEYGASGYLKVHSKDEGGLRVEWLRVTVWGFTRVESLGCKGLRFLGPGFRG